MSSRTSFFCTTRRSASYNFSRSLLVRSYVAPAVITPEQHPPPRSHNSTKPVKNRLEHAQTLTALHTTRGLLPRVLSPQSPDFAFWSALLKNVSDELSGVTASARELNVVVYPLDEYAGADVLVSALLEDPFSSSEENERVRNRWEGLEGIDRLVINYASDPTPPPTGEPTTDAVIPPAGAASLHLSSSFLTSLTVPVHLVELRPPHTPSHPSQDNLRALYTADVPLIVINPLTTPLNTISTAFQHHPLPPHAIVLVTAPSPASPSETFISNISSHLPPGPSPKILLIDPARAYSGVRALGAAPANALHVQRYSDDAVGSGLTTLMRSLSAEFPPTSSTSATVPSAPERKAAALLRASLSTLHNALSVAADELRAATHIVRILRGEAAQTRRDAHARVSGGAEGKEKIQVMAAMDGADAVVQPALDRLTWWRVLWAPDEVGWRVRVAVRDAWVGVERALLPALAPLPSDQVQLTSTAHKHLSALPAPLRSPVLINTLQQLAHAPSFPVHTSAVLAPLATRLGRFDAATARLARAAQGLLVRVALSVASGAGTLVWGAGAGFWALVGGEGIGAGLLVAVGGVRWAIGRWERARRAWRADWVRVKEGAERDVEGALDETLEKQVLVVPIKASEGIEEIVARRADEIEVLKAEVSQIESVCLFGFAEADLYK
ncbi:hypothetical protein FA95DRAFT_1681772 [Auriscalpium vulgare]|uniref:Uncharacterized protein n=1 Tax=Auriscalpium vulgare TaxID=40419 RepID=A0ACB8RHR2_9AGAM|nr:hypothetical protein FA95DRAFT_1681772 [Auriscalpium vulgare]